MEIRTIGIDLGKTVFHLVGVNARGEVVARKKCSRTQLLRFTSNVPACLIGMEACARSRHGGEKCSMARHEEEAQKVSCLFASFDIRGSRTELS
ncbi:MAG TPA: hypothetical protein VMB49_00905 [Acidobacteriaceae bacterium]|nr:hypothetical protein [Acidobacteriaceae bacterium]